MARIKDRRVERTRQALEAALLFLMKEKEFDAISVQEIIDRANVGRATFYMHYENKEDLLESGFNGLLASLREGRREQRSRPDIRGFDDQLFAFSRHLLAHADEHRRIFPAMVSKRGGSFIQHLLRELIVKVVREDVNELRSSRPTSPVPDEAIVQFIAGGLFGLMMWWMSGRMRMSVEDVDEAFRGLAIGALASALRRA
jgi:AcrR family transcriptional regulator